MEDIKNIIESLLFVAEAPLKIDRIKNVLALSDTKEIRKVISELWDEYEAKRVVFFYMKLRVDTRYVVAPNIRNGSSACFSRIRSA